MLSINSKNQCRIFLALALAGWFLVTLPAKAQGPAPETAPTLFPGGALVSYNSIFTTRAEPQTGITPASLPTFSHEGDFNFTWGFHPNFDLAVLVPVVTNHFTSRGTATVGGTGLGDIMALLKYRFYRRDSERGTTQASVTFGPKLPTGQTGLTGANGTLLPATLQPGSGSTDFFLSGNWTYTGLFNLRRLVADEDFHSLLRTTGTQDARLGNNLESRFWLSYRPYEAKDGSKEWFIGPDFSWLYFSNDQMNGNTQNGTGGHALLAGITTYVSARAGMHLWLGADWDIVHSSGAAFNPVRRRISFGITQQFRLHI
ncbi:MAG TPA: hypothetical protein VFR24_09655 [Candidatus Angelobacter sp.]|nr:hypothetical protein [Candidatus Angelobacter sp.]